MIVYTLYVYLFTTNISIYFFVWLSTHELSATPTICLQNNSKDETNSSSTWQNIFLRRFLLRKRNNGLRVISGEFTFYLYIFLLIIYIPF